MAYVDPNFKTKKDLIQAVKQGKAVYVFQPGMGQVEVDGVNSVEGPHFPEPHRWWARVECRGCKVIKVL